MIEILGVTATLFIIAGFLQSGELKIRILDCIGAVLFVIYGVTIHSFSTVLLNGILIGIQIFKIVKLKSKG